MRGTVTAELAAGVDLNAYASPLARTYARQALEWSLRGRSGRAVAQLARARSIEDAWRGQSASPSTERGPANA
jgi:hypothetical protein